MHFVQRKDIKLELVSVVVERSTNVQERWFEVHVVSQEGVDGEGGAISLMYSVELITVLIILPIIKCMYLNAVMFSAEVIFCFLKGDFQF
jgi:hypothetical protein